MMVSPVCATSEASSARRYRTLERSDDHIPHTAAQVWINQSDIILIGLRDYQDAKADVILKYNADEARNLKSYGELPENGK